MNSLSPPEFLVTPPSSVAAQVERHSLQAFRSFDQAQRSGSSRKILSGLGALIVQGTVLAGLVYGTNHSVVARLENVTVVNLLDEIPIVRETPPPPPPSFEQPIIHMQVPLVTITELERPKAAPTAIISNVPPPPPVGVDDGERERLIVEFQRSLQRHLIRNMRYPPAARARKEEGIVFVRVAMSRSGHVQSAIVQEASDFPDLNAEAMAVVTRAQPLPLPPDVVEGDPVDLIIPVTFSLRMHGRGGRGDGRRGGDRGDHRDSSFN